MKSTPTREDLLARAFSDLPLDVAGIPLRPLSAGSFTLLGRLGNPMMVGGSGADDGLRFDAVVQYVWAHSAPLDEVLAVGGPDDVPAAALDRLGFQIPIGEAFAFLMRYQESALRMTASLAEVEPEGDDAGKPQAGRGRAGSPASFTPAARPETPSGSGISSGTPPSSAPSDTCTPPTSPTEPPAGGFSQTLEDRPLGPALSPS